ncbi:hypothetical protein PGB90_009488 [Kerria lacca]
MLKILPSYLSILRSCRLITKPNNSVDIIKRYSSYLSSKPIPKDEDLPKYEVTNDPKEWEFVMRLLPDKKIPEVKEKKEYPSGWKPQKFNPNMPYAIQRTKNHMIPIYLCISHNNMRRITVIKKIHGDIWTLASDVRNYLEKLNKKKICVKIHEILGRIEVHGDHVSNLIVWAEKRNF